MPGELEEPQGGQGSWSGVSEREVGHRKSERKMGLMGLGRSFVDNGGFGGHSQDFGFYSQ